MTSVDICNMALAYLGNSRPITTLTDDTTEARLCSRFYDISRELLLSEFSWSFAKKTCAALTEITDETNDLYSYVYEYPDDALRILFVGVGDESPGTINNYDTIYTLDGSTHVRRIVCDIPEAKASYIINLKDVQVFPAHFSTALAWRVAAYVSTGLSKDSNAMKSISQAEYSAVEKAKYLDAIQNKKPVNIGNRYAAARKSSSLAARW